MRVIIVILSLFSLGIGSLAYSQQTMTFEEKIRAEVDFPKWMLFGGRQRSEFPKATLDLNASDILTKVPYVLYRADPVERKPLLGFQLNDKDFYTPTIKIEFELKR
ncbi:MAG: hypothetical protein N2450_05300 [bacterium]|nr:hypothetical protein [bacterium]